MMGGGQGPQRIHRRLRAAREGDAHLASASVA